MKSKVLIELLPPKLKIKLLTREKIFAVHIADKD